MEITLQQGFQSIAIGYNAQTNTNSETALGYNAVTNKENSTAVGSEANALGQFSTAIGYGATTSQANAIVLGNNNANVGIGTGAPNTSARLDVNGQFKFGEKGSIQKNQISFEAWPEFLSTICLREDQLPWRLRFRQDFSRVLQELLL